MDEAVLTAMRGEDLFTLSLNDFADYILAQARARRKRSSQAVKKYKESLVLARYVLRSEPALDKSDERLLGQGAERSADSAECVSSVALPPPLCLLLMFG
eukprot:6210169-Pleurochrysis_carterae.AAC.2